MNFRKELVEARIIYPGRGGRTDQKGPAHLVHIHTAVILNPVKKRAGQAVMLKGQRLAQTLNNWIETGRNLSCIDVPVGGENDIELGVDVRVIVAGRLPGSLLLTKYGRRSCQQNRAEQRQK